MSIADRNVDFIPSLHGAKAIQNTAQEAIDRLREYRAAPISAAVTSKIDIREEGA